MTSLDLVDFALSAAVFGLTSLTCALALAGARTLYHDAVHPSALYVPFLKAVDEKSPRANAALRTRR